MPSIKILQSLNIAGAISANTITVNTVSALSSMNIPQGGDINGNLKINGDLTVNHLTALSGSTFVNTTFTTTSSLCVNSIMNLGPSFYVGSNGTGDIASFYDTDSNVEVLHIGGANGSNPNVGIKVSDPTKTLTVSGEISASGDVWFGSNIYSNNTNINTLYAANTQTTIITATGTTVWNKPAGAKTIQFIALGGGGSGQGGGMWDGATAVAAAAGGGGGGMNDITLNASNLPESLNVIIGTGGASVSGRTSPAGPVNGNAGSPTILSGGGLIYVYAGAGQGGGTANNGGVYNGNNGATTVTSAGFNMRGGAGGGRGGSLTSVGIAQNGTNGGDGMAGALLGGIVGTNSNSANGSAGGSGSLIDSIVGLTVSSGGGGGGTSAFVTGIGGAGGAGGGFGTGGGGGGAGKGGGGASGAGTSGFAVIITNF
jgi:hypothetical protein